MYVLSEFFVIEIGYICRHTRNKDRMFPDGSVRAAGNKCRNPDNSKTLWCYTTDKKKRWEYCSVPRCGGVKPGRGEYL